MYRHLAGLAFSVLLMGCAADWDPDRPSAVNQDAASKASHSAVPFRNSATAATRRKSFAALPDRGELLSYDADRVPLRRGAYTSYPVNLSEEHALRAAQPGGAIVIRSPEGKSIRLAYERHVEHPDGNWTWIGRDEDGSDAVLTFGEKAVFGTIPNGEEEPLRLRIANGHSWLMATDRSKIADINRAVTRSGEPDYLIPPKLAAAASTSKNITVASMQNQPVAAGAAGFSTVDIVLGYTAGFAAANGGASGAGTRLNYLVELGNQTYVNSQINARLRFVGAVPVNYPDATRNVTALEELTGYRQGVGQIPRNAAFNGLIAARDQFGGDLVSLVRAFRAPENDGCGIAWLIGSEQSGIETEDEPFGYSVVSDGTDLDEGDNNTYFCRDETLVHELGHSMGQAHDSENSVNSGVHPYSYGYRESSPTGFYTVMAYRLPNSSQTAIPYFANPNVLFANRPTGVVNASDNARSMNQTIPIVATFRATVIPFGSGTRNDVDGDGKSDIIWYRPSQLAYSIMDGTSIIASSYFYVSSNYSVAATGDYNGDGRTDILWTSPARDLYLWVNTGNGFSAPQSLGTYDQGWVIIKSGGDINGDGKSDIIWHRPGLMAYTIMDGASIIGSRYFYVSSNYSVATTGDYDGDGRTDVLWTSAARDLYVWMSRSDGFFGPPQSLGGYGAGWQIVPTEGDFNGDAKSDILWHRPGRLAHSIMNGASIAGSRYFYVSSNYVVAGTGDYDGDERMDILWTSPARDLYMWFARGESYSAPQSAGGYGAGWSIVP